MSFKFQTKGHYTGACVEVILNILAQITQQMHTIPATVYSFTLNACLLLAKHVFCLTVSACKCKHSQQCSHPVNSFSSVTVTVT